ncbi:MAG: metal-dependent hydrolase [Halobacteriota archaeon]
MFRLGHYGVSLLAFAPVGFVLLVAGEGELAFVAGVVMLWLAMLPDLDHRIPGISHRGPTHTLAFALLVGATFGVVGAAMGGLVETTIPLSAFGAFVGTVAILAHLFGDLLTPMGVALFWPLSSRRYSLRIARADNTVANYGLFALGIFVSAGALWSAVRLL